MAEQLPSPSPSPPGSPADVTLSTRINSATRKQHTELNRLIIHRLSLALPPVATNPFWYAKGITAFSKIFLLFEIEWELLERHLQRNDAPSMDGREREIRTWLAGLRPDGLLRTPRIKQDSEHLLNFVGPQVNETVSLGDEWSTKMRALVRQKPHLFVAFAWVFYMAIFSGGRWIRQQLANAGPSYWLGADAAADNKYSDTELAGFLIFSFDGTTDGEDLKALFKSRLLEAETLLFESEKLEVVEMSQLLFERSILLISELDEMAWQHEIWSRVRPLRMPAVVLLLLLGLLYAWYYQF